MSIFDTHKKDLSNVDWKYDMRKVCASSVNSSSTLFFCSISVMYNRFNSAQKQRFILKSYIPGTDKLIDPKIHYEYFFENIVNKVHDWIEKHPHVIKTPNVSDSIFVEFNGTIVNK